MQEVERSRSGSPSIVKRGLAVVVLVIAAYILLKLVIGIVTALAVPILVILAIVAIVWALRVL
jgi:siroheme synthase